LKSLTPPSQACERVSIARVNRDIRDMGLTIAQLSARLRCAECGGQLHSVKPWRLEDVLGKPLGRRG
jgi:hypothetical protein